MNRLPLALMARYSRFLDVWRSHVVSPFPAPDATNLRPVHQASPALDQQGGAIVLIVKDKNNGTVRLQP